ncbi:unnamed protein product [Mytilus coruscus]|uniref:Uncharacterized protein n=1 Tax=Mytilus coruscus TaxID=42192 RepID=A0A6J7ZV68_MYTCO|nr:unnamed protein product [Mytilus coruscus]
MDLPDNSGWIQLNECRGYATNIHQAEEVRKTFEVSKSSIFVSYKTILNFGKNDKIPEKYRIRLSDLGEEVVPYDGTPFIITGRKVNSCIFGKDKHIADKKKKQQDKASNLETTGDPVDRPGGPVESPFVVHDKQTTGDPMKPSIVVQHKQTTGDPIEGPILDA